MLTISEKAIEYIIKEENSDEGYYNKLCRGFEWPGGASGPTVGIGYDCGYCNRNEIDRDWRGRISDDMVGVLLAACGRTHGSAHEWVQGHRHQVDIPWDVAVAQFVQCEVPKWVGRTTAVLPNCEFLSGDSLGALVSCSYNRGSAWRMAGDRTLEMRNIYDHMVNHAFEKIPDEFRAMARHWPNVAQLRARRRHEADLFEAGLVRVPEVVSQG